MPRLPLRGALPLFLVALAACGGRVSPDEQAASTSGDASSPPSSAASSSVPSFGSGGPTDPVPLACAPCTASRDCGPSQHGCVASMGAPFCAAGCSKDGFCDAAQTCTTVFDPDGVRWRACLAPQGDPCGRGPLRPAPQAGSR